MGVRRPPRLLFVSHQSSRTGAPIVLLHLLRWLRANTDVDFEVLLLRDGPLAEEFARLAPVHHVPGGSLLPVVERFEKGLDYLGVGRLGGRVKGGRYRFLLSRLGRFDLVYLNAAPSFSLAALFPPWADHALVGHLHELEMGLKASLPDRPVAGLLPRFDRIIACCDAVASHLTKDHDLPGDRLSRHYEFVDPQPAPSSDDVARVRAELMIPEGAAVVGNLATIEWRKGPDVFVQLAARLHRRRPDREIVLLWVGVDGAERELGPLLHELHHAGVAHLLRFVPPVADVRPYYAMFDVLALTSREDPFPLVCLEAAVQEVPVVAFEGGGGIPEFLLPDCGVVVPYLDVEEMAEAVEHLLADPARARELGRRAATKVRDLYTVDVVAPEIWRDIEAVLATRRERAGR